MNEYLFSYSFKGARWSTSVFADNEAEAKLKIQAQAQANYDGVLVVSIPLPTGKKWAGQLVEFMKRVGERLKKLGGYDGR